MDVHFLLSVGSLICLLISVRFTYRDYSYECSIFKRNNPFFYSNTFRNILKIFF